MARFKNIPQYEEGKIVYGDKIVDGIVEIAVKEIPFVKLIDDSDHEEAKNKAVRVKREKDGVHVDVFVKIHFSQSVSDLSFKIQESVRHAIETMTEYHVANVNVAILDVIFDDAPKTEVIANEDKTTNGAPTTNEKFS